MKKKECTSCDFENAKKVGRAHWICPKCERDFSLEYYMWFKSTYDCISLKLPTNPIEPSSKLEEDWEMRLQVALDAKDNPDFYEMMVLFITQLVESKQKETIEEVVKVLEDWGCECSNKVSDYATSKGISLNK